MASECEELISLLTELNGNLSGLRQEFEDLKAEIGKIKPGNERETILNWVAGDIQSMGIVGLMVGGTATATVFGSSSWAGTQQNITRLFGDVAKVENEVIPLKGRFRSVEGGVASNKASVNKARLDINRSLERSRKATAQAGMAHQEARNVASQTRKIRADLRKKVDTSRFNRKIKGLGQRISKFNVDLGKLGGRIAKNTKIGRTAIGLGKRAVKLYQKVPGPLRKALSTALKAFSIASSIVDIVAGLASIVLIKQLQSQIDALNVRINASDRYITVLEAQLRKNGKLAGGNFSRTQFNRDAVSKLRQDMRREDLKQVRLLQNYYRSLRGFIQGNRESIENTRKDFKVQIEDVKQRIRDAVSGLSGKIDKVLSGQEGILSAVNQSKAQVNAHTTKEVGKIKPGVVAAVAGIGSVVAASVVSGNKGTRAAIRQAGSSLGQQIANLRPAIARAPKGAEQAAKSAAKEAKRAGTYSRIIEPKVTGTLRQANVIGSKQNVEAANARWERLRNRGKQDKLDNEIGKAQKQIADVAGRQKAATKAPKVNLKPALDKLNVIDQKLGPQIKSKTGKKIGISGRLTNIWKTGLVNQVISGLNLMLELHNAAMLSRNLIESVGDMFSIGIQVFQRIILRQDGDEVKPIDVNQLIGQGFNGIMVDIFGKETWTAIILKWNSINRIITSAANVANSVRNMFDGVAGVVSSTANNVGRIGNALKNNRVVEQGSYAFMPTSNTAATGRIASLNNVLNNSAEIPDLVTSIGSEAIGVVDESEEMGRNFGNLSNKAEQDKQAKAAQAEAERKASTASDLSVIDFLPNFGGDD